MADPNILEIDSHVFNQIATILENKSTRDSFLQSIPSNIFTPTSIQLMDNESYKPHMTTAKWLLWCLGTQDVRVSEFVQYLEKAKLEKALMLLKKDVPIKIIKQPPSIIHVQIGTKLSVTCEATSFPRAEYQWFKGNEELLLQQDPILQIDSIMPEDSGLYVCRLVKPNLDPNSDPWSYAFSNLVEVVVSEECSQNSHFQAELIYSPKLILDSFSTEESLTSISDNLEQVPSFKHAKIRSKVQPVGGKIPQGVSITLHCKAKYINSDSKLEIKYQWYKNGRPIEGATSRDLPLYHLYPDKETGNMKWQYYCMAFNDYDHEISNVVDVQLENETDKTAYFASEKYAFMIANDTYDNLQDLKKPPYDVSDLGRLLEKNDFKVSAYRNLNLAQMKNAFKKFYMGLEQGCYVLVYFAGHGFQQFGQVYLQPVDCSEMCDPRKTICVDEILQCLQTTKPACNIILVDTCRNLPPHLRNSEQCVSMCPSVQKTENFKQFEARMGSNTIYGYSTPFLYSSHESDSESNSFFVKYLKKYISPDDNNKQDESIINILHQVQRDFNGDPLVKNIQMPEIRSTLAGNQKFSDPILRNSEKSPGLAFTLNDFREDLAPRLIPTKFPLFGLATIIIKASPYLDIFMNDIEIVVSIFIDRNAHSHAEFLYQAEIDFVSDRQEIQLSPATSVRLKDIDIKVNDTTILLKKTVFGIQKLEYETLNCKLVIKHPQLKTCQEGNVEINVKNITDLKLSVNYLGSLINESHSS